MFLPFRLLLKVPFTHTHTHTHHTPRLRTPCKHFFAPLKSPSKTASENSKNLLQKHVENPAKNLSKTPLSGSQWYAPYKRISSLPCKTHIAWTFAEFLLNFKVICCLSKLFPESKLNRFSRYWAFCNQGILFEILAWEHSPAWDTLPLVEALGEQGCLPVLGALPRRLSDEAPEDAQWV